MKKIILDTNFLLIPGQFMVDIFSEIERIMNEPYVLVVLDCVHAELEKVSIGKSKDARAAQLGLALVAAKKSETPTLWEKLIGLSSSGPRLKIVKTRKGYADTVIVGLADKDTLVATQDAGLKKKLKKKKVSVITLAGKKKLKLL